jgi:hypothetical protein
MLPQAQGMHESIREGTVEEKDHHWSTTIGPPHPPPLIYLVPLLKHTCPQRRPPYFGILRSNWEENKTCTALIVIITAMMQSIIEGGEDADDAAARSLLILRKHDNKPRRKILKYGTVQWVMVIARMQIYLKIVS